MQDTDTNLSLHMPGTRKEDIRATPEPLPKERARATGWDNIAPHAGWFRRCLAFLSGLLSLQLSRKHLTRRDQLLRAVLHEKDLIAPRQDLSLVAFKGPASTLATPLGTYAGKAPSHDMRKAAEKQFHAMQPSDGTAIH